MSRSRPPGSGPEPAPVPEAPPAVATAAATRTASLPAPTASGVVPTSGRVKVQAFKMGYYAHIRRRPGDVFWIEDPRDFATTWMQVVDPDVPERITLGNEAIREDHDRVLTTKAQEAALRRGEFVRPPLGPPTGEANPLGDDD